MKIKQHCLVLGIICMCFFSMQSQGIKEESCDSKIEEAVHFIKLKEQNPDDIALGLSLLQSCADGGSSEAQFILGILNVKGKIIPKNEKLAFTLFEKAAQQDHAAALCELAIMYKDGIACKLNFETALDLFEQAYALGNQRSGYKIGYMYFKGLGSIDQNYARAIEWFKKSDYPMSKHFLGICNYFGYGVPVNKEKATELFVGNPTTNSKFLIAHLDNHPEILELGKQKDNTVNASEFTESKIRDVVIKEPTAVDTNNEIVFSSKELLKGDWSGKLIELDWGQEKMLRSFPVTLTLDANNSTNDLDYMVSIGETANNGLGVFLNENYHFENFKVKLPRIYQDNDTLFELEYDILSMNSIEVKEINNIKYLTAFVEGRNISQSEPMQPMLLILGNSKALTSNGVEIDNTLISELANLKGDNFISTYPNPFTSDLLVQYDLSEESITSVSIYSLAGDFNETIVANEEQKEGKHLYYIDGSRYKNGVYVVKIQANNISHTKLIIKE